MKSLTSCVSRVMESIWEELEKEKEYDQNILYGNFLLKNKPLVETF